MTVTLKPSFSHLATDPLRNFKFRIAILNPDFPGMVNMGFMSLDGLSITTEVIPYREGGMNTTTQKMPGQSDFSPITLSTGLAIAKGQAWDWMKQLFSVVEGDGTGHPGQNFRHSVDIKVLDHPVTSTTDIKVKAWWRVYNAWPTSVSFSNLDAGAQAIVVQQLTLAHEGFDMMLAKTVQQDLQTWNPKQIN